MIRPLENRICVTEIEAEVITKGGIFIPETVRPRPLEGIVLAAGPGKMLESGKIAPMTVRVGDRVLYGKFAGVEVSIDGAQHRILTEDDVLAIRDDISAANVS